MTDEEARELAFFRDQFGEDFYRNRPQSGPRKQIRRAAAGRGKSEADFEIEGGVARTRIFRTPELDVGESITYRVDAVLVSDPEVASTYEPVTLNGYAIASGRDGSAILEQARQRAAERLERKLKVDGALRDFPVLAVRQKQEVSVVHVLPTEDELDARIEARMEKRGEELEAAFEKRVRKEAERIAQAELSSVVERLEESKAREVAEIREAAAAEVRAVEQDFHRRVEARAAELSERIVGDAIMKVERERDEAIKRERDAAEKRVAAVTKKLNKERTNG